MKVEKLYKYYGDKIGIEDISFTLGNGQILGVIGHNGSGKSTLFKTILGLIPKHTGNIELENKKIGYVPENRALFQDVRMYDYLRLIANLHEVSEDIFKQRLKKLAKLFGNEENIYKRIHTLSKGNQQKIQFMGALIHNPEIIILDEPMSGLDITNVNLIKGIITQLKEEGKQIILSSHQYDDVEMFCDEILILRKGKKVIQGNIRYLKEMYSYSYVTISYDQYGKYQNEIGVLDVQTIGNLTRYKVDKEVNMKKLIEKSIRKREGASIKIESISIKDMVEIGYEDTH